jgi:chemotaxis protein CheD
MGHFAPREHGSLAAIEEQGDPRAEAARKRLRECKDQANACEIVREIVSNLLGCEEMALFAVDRRQQTLALVWSFGVEPGKLHLPQRLSDSALSGVLGGEACIAQVCGHVGSAGDEDKASAFVPIQFGGQTAGVLALLRLLPQKTNIDQMDRALLAVISSEAGRPLFGGSGLGKGERKR